MSQFESWNDFIQQLEDNEACDTELEKVKECGNFENFFKHENIFDWLAWIFDNCLDHPWPEAEPIILTDACFSYRYALDVLKRPWPEAEPIILKNAWCSCDYARLVLKRPWPEAEPIILTNAWLSYCYALEILGRPWPEAEPIIMTNAWLSGCYARDVLKRPWPEAEPIIMTDVEVWMYYSAWKGGMKHEKNS